MQFLDEILQYFHYISYLIFYYTPNLLTCQAIRVLCIQKIINFFKLSLTKKR